jgi:GNAT superfamily N-acetyltransferase
MTTDSIRLSETRDVPLDEIVALYRANDWSSADKPELLHAALLGSHSLITAWDGERLVGLGNAISDGHLVVYYPHLLVLPEYQGRSIGTALMQRLMQRAFTCTCSPLMAGRSTSTASAASAAPGRLSLCGSTRATITEPCIPPHISRSKTPP